MMAHLKSPFVLIPIFLNVILLVGIRYFNSASQISPLYPLLGLALAGSWVMYLAPKF